jgi:hypothetical protein
MEFWKKIPGYPGYSISSNLRVRKDAGDRILKVKYVWSKYNNNNPVQELVRLVHENGSVQNLDINELAIMAFTEGTKSSKL